MVGNFFLSLHRFFNNNRLVFFTAVVAAFVVAGYLASRLQFEEDISRMIPTDEKTNRASFILRNSRFSDRLVINISQADTSKDANPDRLTVYAETLVQQLDSIYKPTYISEITATVPEDLMLRVNNIFYNNLPLFLEEKDYLKIDSLIAPHKIDEAMEKNYNTLISPAGSFLKKHFPRPAWLDLHCAEPSAVTAIQS